MTNITVEQIKERLSKSFADIKDFRQFDSSILNSRCVNYRVVSQFNFMGLTLRVLIYTIANEKEIENDTAKWFRVVDLFGQNKSYYF